MSIRKRKGSPHYWYDFTVKGTRLRGSTETNDIETAKALEAKLRTDTIHGNLFGTKARMTLNMAASKYLKEHGQYLPTAMDAIDVGSRSLLSFFRQGIHLDEINDAEVNGYISHLRERNKPATINRRLDHLRAIMNRARKQWGVEVSGVDIGTHRLEMPEARTRWITPAEADKLIECAVPHLKAPIRFALLTGARLSNITGLQWEDVNLQQRIIRLRGVKSKKPGGKTLELVVTDALLRLLIEQKPKKNGNVFVRRFKEREAQPIEKFRRSFKTACKNAGIKDFRFHDLRHTAASWMVQNGVPLDVVKEVLGHSEISMTQKYAHRENTAQADAMDKLSAAQIRHTGKRGKVA